MNTQNEPDLGWGWGSALFGKHDYSKAEAQTQPIRITEELPAVGSRWASNHADAGYPIVIVARHMIAGNGTVRIEYGPPSDDYDKQRSHATEVDRFLELYAPAPAPEQPHPPTVTPSRNTSKNRYMT
jgi:hypothetical protein